MPAVRVQDYFRLSCRRYSATAYYMPANHGSGGFSTILRANRRDALVPECSDQILIHVVHRRHVVPFLGGWQQYRGCGDISSQRPL